MVWTSMCQLFTRDGTIYVWKPDMIYSNKRQILNKRLLSLDTHTECGRHKKKNSRRQNPSSTLEQWYNRTTHDRMLTLSWKDSSHSIDTKQKKYENNWPKLKKIGLICRFLHLNVHDPMQHGRVNMCDLLSCFI